MEAVYQQQSLKLTANQQLEQDQLNDDLEKQMCSLFQSHAQRKHQQSEGFVREAEALDAERQLRFRELELKIKAETDEFDLNSRSRLGRLRDEQRDFIERFDKECQEKYGIILAQQPSNSNNRHSVYNFGNLSHQSPVVGYTAYFGGSTVELDAANSSPAAISKSNRYLFQHLP